MKFCQNCGARLESESKFCVACGTPVTVISPTPVEPTIHLPKSSQQEEPIYQHTREAANSFTEAISGKTNLIQRVINIITKPKQEWQVVATEEPNAINLIGGYALILALIPAVAGFIKYGIIGVSFMGTFSQSISAGIQTAIIQLFSAIIGVYLLAWAIEILAPTFDSTKNFGRSLQLAVYSSTVQWVAGILLLVSNSAGRLIMLIGLYAIYLLAVGMPVLKNTPQEKVVGYVALTIVAMIVISLVMALVLGSIMGVFFAERIGF